MPSRKKDASGLICARLLLEMVRACALVFLDRKFAASSAGDVLLCTAVYIGQSEGKRMTAAKLGEYSGMPRPTVVRRMADLQARGVVACDLKKRWALNTQDPLVFARVGGVIDALLPLVHSAAIKLSKMDSAAIAVRERPSLQNMRSDFVVRGKKKSIHDK